MTASAPQPYLPKGRTVAFAPLDNTFMQAAKKAAQDHSLDKKHPTGAVIVMDDVILGRGANGSSYHEENGCERKRLNIPTGEGYELCEGCSPKNHAEPTAIRNAIEKGNSPQGADLYLWGHWWCCEGCWGAMIENEIANVYLVEGAWEMFGRE